MKKIIFVLFAALSFSVSAKDVLTLSNNLQFEGQVLSVKNSFAEFQSNGELYMIPLMDINSILIEDTTSVAYSDLMNMDLPSQDPCLLGQLDAEMYHGKKGAHFALGALFGPFALIGTALCNPTPDKGNDTYAMSKNKEHFSDPSYLSCYKKKARNQMLTYDAIGWAAWIVLLFIL